jgi:hypothetical protein
MGRRRGSSRYQLAGQAARWFASAPCWTPVWGIAWGESGTWDMVWGYDSCEVDYAGITTRYLGGPYKEVGRTWPRPIVNRKSKPSLLPSRLSALRSLRAFPPFANVDAVVFDGSEEGKKVDEAVQNSQMRAPSVWEPVADGDSVAARRRCPFSALALDIRIVTVIYGPYGLRVGRSSAREYGL